MDDTLDPFYQLTITNKSWPNLGRVFCALMFLMLPFSNVNSSEAGFNEYDLKVAYLYNFTKFMKWPNSSFKPHQSTFNICIKGEMPPQKAIDQLETQTTQGRSIKVLPLLALGDINNCHIVYFRNINNTELTAFIQHIKNQPILTVSDQKAFAVNAGIIEFSMENRRIKLTINHQRAKNCGIDISAQLLEIASVIPTTESI